MELKIKSLESLGKLTGALSCEGYAYTVKTIYKANTSVIGVIDYYLVNIKE